MTRPHAMPIGFTYDGEPLYAAAPAGTGEQQALAITAAGEAVWPTTPALVGPGQPQPFGVLASGAFVWAVEQPPAAPRRSAKRLIVAAVAFAAVMSGVAGAWLLTHDDDPRAAVRAAPVAAADPPATEEPAREQPVLETSRVDFTMPDLLGVNLQQAQDSMQRVGVAFSRSHDLLGTRLQVVDSGWRVCDQVPAAGTRVRGSAADWEGRIDFGVVRLSEQCPSPRPAG